MVCFYWLLGANKNSPLAATELKVAAGDATSGALSQSIFSRCLDKRCCWTTCEQQGLERGLDFTRENDEAVDE